jgi:two-component system, NtrC family, response regulator HydG
VNDRPTLLVVDDKQNMRSLLARVLRGVGDVTTARGVADASALIAARSFSLVLSDLRMEDGDGLAVLRALRAKDGETPFVLMTAFATIETAVQAMREGADDYITKPFEPDALVAKLAGLLARGGAITPGAAPTPWLLGESPSICEVRRQVGLFAPSEASVLVLGETGTGKELVARALHAGSRRAARPLVAVNCAALPSELVEAELFGHARGAFTGAVQERRGLFEAASGSTLFLDEIGDISAAAQAKLTRVLEERAIRRVGDAHERPVDVRVVAATHRDLSAMSRSGAFREDLFFRLNVCAIELPPLRERPGDIPLLCRHFLAQAGAARPGCAIAFSDEALARMSSYSWPGNVRELRSVIERCVILETRREIQASSLPPAVSAGAALPSVDDLSALPLRGALDAARDDAHRRYLAAVLRRFDGNVQQAAVHAGVERESFYRLLRRYGLVAEAFRRSSPEG